MSWGVIHRNWLECHSIPAHQFDKGIHAMEGKLSSSIMESRMTKLGRLRFECRVLAISIRCTVWHDRCVYPLYLRLSSPLLSVSAARLLNWLRFTSFAFYLPLVFTYFISTSLLWRQIFNLILETPCSPIQDLSAQIIPLTFEGCRWICRSWYGRTWWLNAKKFTYGKH